MFWLSFIKPYQTFHLFLRTSSISRSLNTIKIKPNPIKPFSTNQSSIPNDTKLRLQPIFLAFFPILTFGLGTWQILRLRWKVKLIEEYEDRLSQPPINLPKRIK